MVSLPESFCIFSLTPSLVTKIIYYDISGSYFISKQAQAVVKIDKFGRMGRRVEIREAVTPPRPVAMPLQAATTGKRLNIPGRRQQRQQYWLRARETKSVALNRSRMRSNKKMRRLTEELLMTSELKACKLQQEGHSACALNSKEERIRQVLDKRPFSPKPLGRLWLHQENNASINADRLGIPDWCHLL